jgi:hypothetical protein
MGWQIRESTTMFLKFRIGQIVNYQPGVRSQDAPFGAYQITVLLPQREDGEFEYQIRNLNEQHERVANESALIAT